MSSHVRCFQQAWVKHHGHGRSPSFCGISFSWLFSSVIKQINYMFIHTCLLCFSCFHSPLPHLQALNYCTSQTWSACTSPSSPKARTSTLWKLQQGLCRTSVLATGRWVQTLLFSLFYFFCASKEQSNIHCKCTVTLCIYVSFKKEGGGNPEEIISILFVYLRCFATSGQMVFT